MPDKSYLVFLLDDDQAFCEEMVFLLEEHVSIKTFQSPDTLLNEIQNTQPDMILVDLNLNIDDQNGIDVVSKIKQTPGSHLYSIVMVTGAEFPDILPQAYRSGIHDYIRKPIIPSDFLPKLENLLFHNRQRIHTNALTGLPGIVLIEEQFNERMAAGGATVGYLDLDNFKPFNDCFGVKAGDNGILLIAKIIHKLRSKFSLDDAFFGHLGGDDFFLVGNMETLKESIETCYQLFEQEVKKLFTKEQVDQGFYTSKSRAGTLEKFPLLTCSSVLIRVDADKSPTFDEVSELAALGKKQAKMLPGNSLVTLELK